jgi:hypothetical protein
MGKFRNGELGSRYHCSHAIFRRFCFPLRLGPQQGNQLVGWSEGAFGQVRGNDRLNSFELLDGRWLFTHETYLLFSAQMLGAVVVRTNMAVYVRYAIFVLLHRRGASHFFKAIHADAVRAPSG